MSEKPSVSVRKSSSGRKKTINLLYYVSNNSRLDVLSALLEHGFLSFTELQNITKMLSPSLNHHLKVLIIGELVSQGKMNGKEGYYLEDWGNIVIDHVDLIATKTLKSKNAPKIAKNWANAVKTKLKIIQRRKKEEKEAIAILVS